MLIVSVAEMVHKQDLPSIYKPKTLNVSKCAAKTKCFNAVAVQLKQKILVLFCRPWKKILAFLCCIVVVEILVQQEYLRSNDIDKFMAKPKSNAVIMEKHRVNPTTAVRIEKQASKPSNIVSIETLSAKISNVNFEKPVLKSNDKVNIKKMANNTMSVEKNELKLSNAKKMEKNSTPAINVVNIEKIALKPANEVPIEKIPTKTNDARITKKLVLKPNSDTNVAKFSTAIDAVNTEKLALKPSNDVNIKKLPTKLNNPTNARKHPIKQSPTVNRIETSKKDIHNKNEKLHASNFKNNTKDENMQSTDGEAYTAPVSKRIRESLRDPSKPLVYLASVNCGERLDEGLTMLKTAIFFGKEANLYFIIFTDKQNQKPLTKQLTELAKVASRMKINLEYELYLIYTKPDDGEKWNMMFAPCATQRLFFPLTLPHIDRLMYLDTDALFFSSVTDLWEKFKIMKPFQLAAIVAEHEPPGDGWYNLQTRVPYYGPRGLNSGIMLMNLDAMRSFGFTDKMISINSAYNGKLRFPDQDMLNIIFAAQPSLLHEIGCEFNFRVQHCVCDYPGTGPCGCKRAEKKGISIFHGNRHAFHGIRSKHFHGKRLDFINNLYNSFNKLDVANSSPKKLLNTLKHNYKSLNSNFACANLSMSIFTKFHKYAEMS